MSTPTISQQDWEAEVAVLRGLASQVLQHHYLGAAAVDSSRDLTPVHSQVMAEMGCLVYYPPIDRAALMLADWDRL